MFWGLTRLGVLLSIFLLSACIQTPPVPVPAGDALHTAPPSAVSPSASPAQALTPVTLYMGYIPNVQFAPFYVALRKGYFEAEGIALQLDYGMENDLVKLVAVNRAQFIIASGDQVILARSQGLPIVYVMNWYRKYPIAVFSLQPLTKPQDLAGKTVGVPGLFGATYIGLRGLLYAAKVPETQVTFQAIGFTQVESLLSRRVDAAVGYSANEPLQLRLAGQTPQVIEVSQYLDLVANGLVTNEKTVQDNPELLRRMVRASLRGLRDTLADPTAAFEMTLEAVPEAAKTRDAQQAVLNASVPFWQSDRLGYNEAAAWETTAHFMQDVGIIQTAVDVTKAFTNDFVPRQLTERP